MRPNVQETGHMARCFMMAFALASMLWVAAGSAGGEPFLSSLVFNTPHDVPGFAPSWERGLNYVSPDGNTMLLQGATINTSYGEACPALTEDAQGITLYFERRLPEGLQIMQAEVVPEPGTLALLAAGGLVPAVVGIRARWRRGAERSGPCLRQ